MGEINGKIRHYGFAGTGWGRDQYVAAGFERVIGFGLEVVQFEGQGFGRSRCCGRPMALDFWNDAYRCEGLSVWESALPLWCW